MQSDKHISKSFDQDLDEAIRLFLYMGDSAANQVAKAIHALIDKDESLAQEVIDMDFDINRMEVELDENGVPRKVPSELKSRPKIPRTPAEGEGRERF